METQNNIKINEESLQNSLNKVFEIFENNATLYEDEDGENIENDFKKISMNSLKDLCEIFKNCKENSLKTNIQEEESIKKVLNKLDSLWEKVQQFQKFAEQNNYTDIMNNFFIVNYFYSIVSDFYNEKRDFKQNITKIFHYLTENPQKISIFTPLELKVEEDSENNNKEDTNKEIQLEKHHFVYSFDYPDSVINYYNNVNVSELWKLFIENAYSESQKVIKNLENNIENIKEVPEKNEGSNINVQIKPSYWKKLMDKLSKNPPKNTTSCFIL